MRFFCIGVCVGFFGLAGALYLLVDTKDACRAANPGYECKLGWVKAGPFK